MARGKGLDDDVTSNDEEVAETGHQDDFHDDVIHEDNNEVSETSYKKIKIMNVIMKF